MLKIILDILTCILFENIDVLVVKGNALAF